MHFDHDGLIVHQMANSDLDGGDTAQREGWFWFGVWIREHKLGQPWTITRRRTFADTIRLVRRQLFLWLALTLIVAEHRLLEPAKDGVFYRHPKLVPWNNPYDKTFGFSRDQMIPLIAAMGVWTSDALRRLWNNLPQDPLGGTKHTYNGEWKTLLGQKLFHTGDPVGPFTINLFRRSWEEDPMKASDGNGPSGENELQANVGVRLHAALTDRDDTGDDLNLIVGLLMAILRFPSSISAQAANLYAKNRPVSYGSFLGAYRDKYGIDMNASTDEVKRRLDEGIAGGWKTDASRVWGAIRWYHREEVGANPELAELYRPIIRRASRS